MSVSSTKRKMVSVGVGMSDLFNAAEQERKDRFTELLAVARELEARIASDIETPSFQTKEGEAFRRFLRSLKYNK